MKAHVYDTKGNFIRELKGEYRDNQFVYKEKTGLFSSVERRIPINYNECLRQKGERYALLEFDGKDYKQLAFVKMGVEPIPAKAFSVRDFVQTQKIAELSIDNIIPSGFGLKDILNWLTFILVIAVAVSVYFISTRSYAMIKSLYQPLNLTISSQAKEIAILQSQNQNLTITNQYLNSYILAHIANFTIPTLKK